MSRKGNCWDNTCSETLSSLLKVERLHGQRFETTRETKDEVIAWLLWYNRTRMHSTLGYRSPASSNKYGGRNNSRLPHEKGYGSVEIATRFQHSHSLDDDGMKSTNPNAYGIRILRARLIGNRRNLLQASMQVLIKC